MFSLDPVAIEIQSGGGRNPVGVKQCMSRCSEKERV
jgi:hypothetical protein